MTAINPFRLRHTEAAAQWRRILSREWPTDGKHQENFTPVEVIASLVMLTVVDPSTQGGREWSRYPPRSYGVSHPCASDHRVLSH